MRAEQRVAAHGRLVTPDRAVVLVRPDEGGRYTLPGSTVRHGEHPRDTVRRAFAEGLHVAAEPRAVLDAVADVADVPARGASVHTVRVVYDVVVPDGRPSQLPGEAVAVPVEEAAGLDLAPFTARVLGLPVQALGAPPIRPVESRPVEAGERDAPPKVQRVGAYALVPDQGRLLLTRYAGSGRWSLPGGGIDHGEQPLDALYRELHEETGLALADARLADVDSVHFTGHAPDGTLEDFHAVRIVYRARVASDAEPAVVEIDGSSDAAAWIPLRDLDRYAVTGFVGVALRLLR